jgi:hypothetical protein
MEVANVVLRYEPPRFLPLQFDPYRECNYTNAPEFTYQMRHTSSDVVMGKGLFNLNGNLYAGLSVHLR